MYDGSYYVYDAEGRKAMFYTGLILGMVPRPSDWTDERMARMNELVDIIDTFGKDFRLKLKVDINPDNPYIKAIREEEFLS